MVGGTLSYQMDVRSVYCLFKQIEVDEKDEAGNREYSVAGKYSSVCDLVSTT